MICFNLEYGSSRKQVCSMVSIPVSILCWNKITARRLSCFLLLFCLKLIILWPFSFTEGNINDFSGFSNPLAFWTISMPPMLFLIFYCNKASNSCSTGFWHGIVLISIGWDTICGDKNVCDSIVQGTCTSSGWQF